MYYKIYLTVLGTSSQYSYLNSIQGKITVAWNVSDIANMAALPNTIHLNFCHLKRKKNHYLIKTADFESNLVETEDWLEQ